MPRSSTTAWAMHWASVLGHRAVGGAARWRSSRRSAPPSPSPHESSSSMICPRLSSSGSSVVAGERRPEQVPGEIALAATRPRSTRAPRRPARSRRAPSRLRTSARSTQSSSHVVEDRVGLVVADGARPRGPRPGCCSAASSSMSSAVMSASSNGSVPSSAMIAAPMQSASAAARRSRPPRPAGRPTNASANSCSASVSSARQLPPASPSSPPSSEQRRQPQDDHGHEQRARRRSDASERPLTRDACGPSDRASRLVALHEALVVAVAVDGADDGARATR